MKSAAVEVKLAKARKDEYELDALAIEHQRWDVQAQVLTGMCARWVYGVRNCSGD